MTAGFGFTPVPEAPDLSVTTWPAGRAVLCILNGPAQGRVIALAAVRSVVGRNVPPVIVDVDLADGELGDTPQISRRHAELYWDGDNLLVRDLGSTNGTRVNRDVLAPLEPVRLRAGDHLWFANLETEVAVGG